MNISKFVWDKARYVNRIPGTYTLYKMLMHLIYRDNTTLTLRRGPAAGYLWRHYRCYQPWMALGIYEPEVAKLIYKTLAAGNVFYDIGANAGYFTLIAARAVGSSGKVMAFDPVPKNAATVQEQVRMNGLQDFCQIEEIAISDSEGTASLSIPGRNANAHLSNIEAPHIADQSGDQITVRCTTLDKYISQHPWPTLIKMDIEGAEVSALSGAKQLITSSQAPVFLITAHSQVLSEQVRKMLHQAGYEFSDFQYMIHAIPPRLRGLTS